MQRGDDYGLIFKQTVNLSEILTCDFTNIQGWHKGKQDRLEPTFDFAEWHILRLGVSTWWWS